LYQNFPNPFNPATKIQFSISRGESVSLVVYNLLGEKVAELLNENLAPSIYSTDFYAKDLPNGTYFYTLKAGEFTQTKKMLLIK
jgi:hypothetical protein